MFGCASGRLEGNLGHVRRDRDAIEVLGASVAAAPEVGEARLALGIAFALAGKFEEASIELRAATMLLDIREPADHAGRLVRRLLATAPG